jgi:hypothetical protein
MEKGQVPPPPQHNLSRKIVSNTRVGHNFTAKLATETAPPFLVPPPPCPVSTLARFWEHKS